MKISTAGLCFVIGFGLTATVQAPAAATTTPPCNTGARILCGAPVLPGHPVSKPSKVRKNGPIARLVVRGH